MEAIYRRMESWGFPAAGTAWLRRRRLPVIIILAILSWALFIALGMTLYHLVF